MKHKVLATIRKFRWPQWLILAAFLLVLCFTGLHAVRTARDAAYWRHHRDEPIRGWMNIGYVAHSYRVPPHVLHQALDLPPKPDKRPLRRIAKAQNRTMDEVRAILQDAINRERQLHPLPLPPDKVPADKAPDKVPDKGGKP